jgi:enoyl-CoA hydratase/carnithine racemase
MKRKRWRSQNPVVLPRRLKAQHAAVEGDPPGAPNRPDKKPLTFELHRRSAHSLPPAAKDKTVKLRHHREAKTCSGSGVFEIIAAGRDEHVGLLNHRMTGQAVKAMRQCPQPILAAIDGVCRRRCDPLAMASDLRLSARAKVAFLFNRVGLRLRHACAILPRIIGQGRASELLYTGRVMSGEEAERWGFFNRLATADSVLADATMLARELADGPTFANAMTKRMLEMEWAMSVEQAIEAEAVAQALCMKTEDFARAFRAFAAKQKPVFEGN